ncbi:hypothetical protein ABZ816_28655 [Actinosynnema sp. NPDC047251]|uniref:Uncharacterized protein n=1 Tax=Saccharothrix espanaensis (strain ATCC 51144 / DSM 44229 / JCM 9112 / NBRC 15066 / NRRL 15764) TaxID=1179773 RepID=K0JU70_SACES|nr:hypothetical protein [Saccharothrix espanaensis]CCH28359.1 hypothetical protein BN6_10310 [Saccharothrix espanaensis DSM 44229]
MARGPDGRSTGAALNAKNNSSRQDALNGSAAVAGFLTTGRTEAAQHIPAIVGSGYERRSPDAWASPDAPVPA